MQRLEEISTKSSLASAIRYPLGHWKGLTMFLVDGRVEVDNNTVERGIRPIPLGRKNALIAGSDRGGAVVGNPGVADQDRQAARH